MKADKLVGRAKELIDAEKKTSGGKTSVYYLSFADVEFLGAVWTRAIGPMSAIRRTHELGINPGGQVMVVKLAPGEDLPPSRFFDKLLSRAQLEEAMPGAIAGVKMNDDGDMEPDLSGCIG